MPLKRLKQLLTGIAPSQAGWLWKTPVLVDRGAIRGAACALDRHGKGLLLWDSGGRMWSQSVGPFYTQAMPSVPMGHGRDPRLALNLDGRGAAVWMQEDGGSRNIVGIPVDVNTRELFAPRTIFQTYGEVRHLQLAADRRGSAVLVWSHLHDEHWETLALVYDLRTRTWEPRPTRLGPRVAHAREPRLAANRRGQMTVLWHEEGEAHSGPGIPEDAHPEGLYAFHYLPAVRSWSDHSMPVCAGVARKYQAALDHMGNILVIYVLQPPGERASLCTTYFSSADSVWSAPRTLVQGPSIQKIQLAMAGGGEALALWIEGEPGHRSILNAKAFSRGTWEDGITRLDGDTGQIGDFLALMGPRGHAAVLYFQQLSEGNVPVIRERAQKWMPAVRLEKPTDRSLLQPGLALCADGVVAHWREGLDTKTHLKFTLRA